MRPHAPDPARHPPPKRDPTRTRHREQQVAIPRRLRGVGGQGAVGAVVGREPLEVGEQVHGPSVSTTDQPSFLKSGYRCRRSTRRRSALANMSWGVRRSPSRRSRTIRTSRQSSKCRRSSSYKFRRLRATTKRSTPTSPWAERSRPGSGPATTAWWEPKAGAGASSMAAFGYGPGPSRPHRCHKSCARAPS